MVSAFSIGKSKRSNIVMLYLATYTSNNVPGPGAYNPEKK